MIQILATIAVTIGTLWGVWNFAPLAVLDFNPLDRETPTLGSAIQTIELSDSVKNALYTKVNANFAQTANTTTPNTWTGLQSFANASSTMFSALQAWFGATATSSFSTAGALTLATPLTVANGGTGSTTLSSNQVLLGNGTGNVTTVNGWGTTNYALVSNGGTSAPTWQAQQTDQTANYTWSGTHTFSNTVNHTSNAGFGTSTPSRPLSVQGTSYLSGGVYFGSDITASSTAVNRFAYASSTMTTSTTASTTNLIASNTATLPFYATTSASQSSASGSNEKVTATAICLSGDVAISGGFNPSDIGGSFNVDNFNQTTTNTTNDSWTTTLDNIDAITSTLTTTAYCLNQ